MFGDYVCKDGTQIVVRRDIFVVSNGDSYRLVGTTLLGPKGVISRYCDDKSIALDIIAKKHGGLKV